MIHFEIMYKEADDGMFDSMLEYPKQPADNVGKYGGMRLQYLQQHRKTSYGMMRLDGTLKQHLLDVNEQAYDIDKQAADPGKRRMELDQAKFMRLAALNAECERRIAAVGDKTQVQFSYGEMFRIAYKLPDRALPKNGNML